MSCVYSAPIFGSRVVWGFIALDWVQTTSGPNNEIYYVGTTCIEQNTEHFPKWGFMTKTMCFLLCDRGTIAWVFYTEIWNSLALMIEIHDPLDYLSKETWYQGSDFCLAQQQIHDAASLKKKKAFN